MAVCSPPTDGHGRPFDDAWNEVLRAARGRRPGEAFDGRRLLWPVHERDDWIVVLEQTGPEWRRAYDREPSAWRRALSVLAA